MNEAEMKKYLESKIGTARSGNWGHTGRPGIRGGSGGSGATGTVSSNVNDNTKFNESVNKEPYEEPGEGSIRFIHVRQLNEYAQEMGIKLDDASGHIQAVEDMTSDAYTAIRREWKKRNAGEEYDEKITEISDKCDTLIEVSPKWGTDPLYRNVAISDMKVFLAGHKSGAVIDQQGVSSWTSVERMDWHGNVRYRLKKGSMKAVNVTFLSQRQHENEVLMHSSAKMIVDEISTRTMKDGSIQTIVDVTEINIPSEKGLFPEQKIGTARSGNWGHTGRPGVRGGSGAGGATVQEVLSNATTMKDRLGKCYELSAKYVSKNHDWELVHGIINGKKFGIDKDNPHAWAEKGTEVYDPVMDLKTTTDIYYDIFGGKPAERYTYKQILEKTIESGHWGPWDEATKAIIYANMETKIGTARSGNWGHTGRPGVRGGSGAGGTTTINSPIDNDKVSTEFSRKEMEAQYDTNKDLFYIDREKYDERSQLKSEVVSRLSEELIGNDDFRAYVEREHGYELERAGNSENSMRIFTEQEVNINIGRWASTSGDHEANALALQTAVAREFGIEAGYDPSRRLFGETINDRTEYEYVHPESYIAAQQQSYIDLINDAVFMKAQQAFVRTEYNQTQAFLKRNGVDEIIVYRGVGKLKSTDADFSKVGYGIKQHTLQPASSFTADPSMTQEFPLGNAMVIAGKVPASRVLSTCQTGRGCASESEIIILGGTDNWKAISYNTHDAEQGREVITGSSKLPSTRPDLLAEEMFNPENMNRALISHFDSITAKKAESATILPDELVRNSDWTKKTWDLPPYKSEEFNKLITDLGAFKTLPVYLFAIDNGLIADDEWTGEEIKSVEVKIGTARSGNWGHTGRPGVRGGSGAGGNTTEIQSPIHKGKTGYTGETTHIYKRKYDTYQIHGMSIRILTPKNMNTTNQPITAEEIEGLVKKLPKTLADCIEVIVLEDIPDPENEALARKYDLEKFVAAASANSLGRITFWGNKERKVLDRVHRTLVHEATHLLDRKLADEYGVEGDYYSEDAVYKKAKQADIEKNGKRYEWTSRYAKMVGSDAEDMADLAEEIYGGSVDQRQLAMNRFPNRSKLLIYEIELDEEAFGEKAEIKENIIYQDEEEIRIREVDENGNLVREIFGTAYQETEQKIGTARSGNWGHTGRPGIRGGSGAGGAETINSPVDIIPNTPNDCFKRVQAMHDEAFEAYSANTGKSVDELKNQLNDIINKAVEGTDVKVRTTEDALSKILDDGRFKTQSETGTSKGELDLELRAQIEETIFGISKESKERPIYGYLFKDSKYLTIEASSPANHLNLYGNCAVKLKPSVKDRSTFIVGDSLASYARNTATGKWVIEEGAAVPVKLTAADKTPAFGLAKELFNPKLPDYVRAEIGDPIGKLTDKPWYALDGSYLEAQIHGGVKTSDIESVIITKPKGKSVNNELIEKLSENGIKYEIIEEKGWADTFKALDGYLEVKIGTARSGNWGHSGRPGVRGGSGAGGATTINSPIDNEKTNLEDYDPDLVVAAVKYMNWAHWKNYKECISTRLEIAEGLDQDQIMQVYEIVTKYNFRDIIFALGSYSTDYKYGYDDIMNLKEQIMVHEDFGTFSRDNGILLTRLDEMHTKRLLDSAMKNVNNEPYLYDRITQIYEVGVSAKLRSEAADFIIDRQEKRGATGFAEKHRARKTAEGEMQYLIDDWTWASGTTGSLWMQAAANKLFHNKDETMVYWNGASNGIILKDVSPVTVQAVKLMYDRTQAFYAKKKVAKEGEGFTVYRGVGTEITTSSPVESWSLNISTAYRFAKMMAPRAGRHEPENTGIVLKDTVPLSKVLFTWESMKGIFPPESELKGKKEVAIIN